MNNPMDVSLLRLYLIRGLFLLMCAGTVATQVPGMLHRDPPWSLMHGVGTAMLLSMAALSAVGVRYPLQLLPILLWELLWKSIWLLVFALPLGRAHQMDADTMESVRACLMGVVLCPLVIPWPYVWNHYVKQAGDRWTRVVPAVT